MVAYYMEYDATPVFLPVEGWNAGFPGGPTVTSVVPDSGPSAGQFTFDSTGTGFTGLSFVLLGGTSGPSAGVTVNSDTSAHCTVGGISIGTGPINLVYVWGSWPGAPDLGLGANVAFINVPFTLI